MKLKIITLVALSLGVSFASAQVVKEPVQKAKKKLPAKVEQKTDFLRVHETEDATLLQTAVTRYEKDGVTVDLIGAIHIADKAYYDKLNKLFTSYDSLLFEMVGGEGMNHGKVPPKPKKKDVQLGFLSKMYKAMANRLDLIGQKEGINYRKKNFVHADLTLKEFYAKQKAKGESLLKLALTNALRQRMANVEEPDGFAIIKALLTNDSDGLKLAIIDTLGAGDDQVMALAGKNSVIIGDRNARCMKVLKQEIANGQKTLGIFYGAAHFPDMEERMLKQGFKKTKHTWFDAWTIKKQPKKKVKIQPKKK